MPKRVDQHQIEDISRAKFQLALPRAWALRNFTSDYGIDCEGEIFDDNGNSTGLSFYVQLKASESKKPKKRKSVKLLTDRIKYYLSKQLPVLIVRYDDVEDKIYTRWVGHIDLKKIKPKAKSHSFSFKDDELWTSESAEKLRHELEVSTKYRRGMQTFPIKVALCANEKVANPALLRSVFRNIASLTNRTLKLVTNEEADVEVTLKPKSCIVQIGTEVCCRVTSKKKINTDVEGQKVSELLLGAITIAFTHLNRDDLVSRIVVNTVGYPILSIPNGMAFGIIKSLILMQHFEEAFELVEEVMPTLEGGFEGAGFHIYVLVSSFYVSPDKRALVTSFLEKRIKELGVGAEPYQVAIAHYNLANHFKSNRMNAAAIRQYRKVYECDQLYRNKEYFYKEVGGVFFDAHRFTCSVEAYEKAYKLSEKPDTGLLYADALMMSGAYKEALDLLLGVTPDQEGCGAEWGLKIYVLDRLVNEFGISAQKRLIGQAKEAALKEHKKSIEEYIENYKVVMGLDALSSNASFNYAASFTERRCEFDDNAWKEAFYGFLVAALTVRSDIEAWTKSLLCLINHKELWPYLHVVVEASYYAMGDDYLGHVITEIQKAIPSQVADGLIKEVEGIASQLDRKSKNEMTVRFYNSDGEIEDIADLVKKD